MGSEFAHGAEGKTAGKYYILTKPSARGMGSDSDSALVTEENLHKIMSEERIERGLKECTTYAGVPDLIPLSGDITVTTEALFRMISDMMNCLSGVAISSIL